LNRVTSNFGLLPCTTSATTNLRDVAKKRKTQALKKKDNILKQDHHYLEESWAVEEKDLFKI